MFSPLEVVLSLDTLTYPAAAGAASWHLVALHGWGANAADLAGLAPYLKLPHFAMTFPDAPHPHPQVPGGRMWYGFPWGYDFRQPHDFEQQADLQTSRQMLKDWLLNLADTSQIPLERTILAGFSQGGAMTIDMGGQLPLAGQIILSGYCHGRLHSPVTPRPVMMVHGTFDPVVPIENAQEAKDALEQQGQPVAFQAVAMGHEILPSVISAITAFCEDLRQVAGNTEP
ncbi:MAG: alpha/beta hydrolase [Spirulina sp.]